MAIARVFPQYARPVVVGALAAGMVVGAPPAALAFDDDPPRSPWDQCTFIVNCERHTNTFDGKDTTPGGPERGSQGPDRGGAYQARTWKYERTDSDGRAWYRNTAPGREKETKSTPDAIGLTKLGFKTSESIIDAARAGDR